ISMKEAIESLGRQFTQNRPGVMLRYNFGSSGELQKQIEAGAPVDLFISAAQRQMDELESKGLIIGPTRRVFARNVLTVIKPAEDTYRPVTYPAAVVKDSKQPALAQAFIALLLSREAQAVLSRLGFQPPPARAR